MSFDHAEHTKASTSDEAIRLNKALSTAGICSRRRADELIAEGAVRINGLPADNLGLKIRPGLDMVEINGQTVSLVPKNEQEHIYIILNKPPLCLTTMSDPEGRRTVMDLLPPELRRRRPFPVGRLDCMSEGLLIMTTDGELAYRLAHPKWHVAKTYHLAVLNQVEEKALDTMRRGMTLKEGDKISGIKVKLIRCSQRETVLELRLIQGINRQIRKMCRDLGLTVSWLKRIKQGPLTLETLPEGQWRDLSREEIAALKKQVGQSETSHK